MKPQVSYKTADNPINLKFVGSNTIYIRSFRLLDRSLSLTGLDSFYCVYRRIVLCLVLSSSFCRIVRLLWSSMCVSFDVNVRPCLCLRVCDCFIFCSLFYCICLVRWVCFAVDCKQQRQILVILVGWIGIQTYIRAHCTHTHTHTLLYKIPS